MARDPIAAGAASVAPVLSFDRVTKNYGGFAAVSELSFSVGRGQIYGFLGPNGAGKTTSLRMLLGMIAPTSGTISVLGHPSVMFCREKVGYLPEERGLYRRMTPVESIVYLGELKGMTAAAARAKALELLDRFGLKAFAKSKIEALSKGMAQKVQIVSTVVHDPDLVILDEPFSGLDPVNQQVLEEMIVALRDEGKTVLFSTHVMQHAERLCDRLVLIAKGRMVFEGTLADARARLPRKVRIKSGAGRDTLATLPGVIQVEMLGPVTADLTLNDAARADALLRACFERDITLEGFDIAEPSLHDIFVELIGPDARVADDRAA
jgi:ABC-2 type transport system ATP-binding protein